MVAMVTRSVFLLLALCCRMSESGGPPGSFPGMEQGMVSQALFPKQFGMGQQQYPNQLDSGQAQFKQQMDIGQVPIFAGKRPLEMPAQFQKPYDIGQMPIFAGKRPIEIPAQFQKPYDIGQMPIFAGKRPLEIPGQFEQQMDIGQASVFAGKRFQEMPAPPRALYNEVNLMPWTQFSGEMQTKFPHYQNFLPHPQVGMQGMGYPFWRGGQQNGGQWNGGQQNGGQWNRAQVNGAQWNGVNVQGVDRNGLGVVDTQGRWRQLPADNPLVDVMSPNRVLPVSNPSFRQQMDSKRSGFEDVNGVFVVPLDRQRDGFKPDATQDGTLQFVDNTKKDAKKDDKSVPTNVDVVQHGALVQQGFGSVASRPL